MFKFNDTGIVDAIAIGSNGYVLAFSDDAEEQYGEGYSVRFYPGNRSPQPYTDECDASIDFSDFAEALSGLDAFPEADRDELSDWLYGQMT